jgi:hypothetical protein
MTSKREDIVSYIATTLTSTAGISSRCYRGRPSAVRREEMPCITVDEISETGSYTTVSKMLWSLQVRVTILNYGDTPVTSTDSIYVDMYKRMMADRQLGFRAFDVVPSSISFQFSEGDNPTLAQQCIFTISYRTSATDPEAS